MLVTRSFFWSYPPPKNHISVSPRHQVSQVSFRIKNQDTLFSFFFFNRCNICEENVSQGNFLRQFCGSPDINLINCLKRFRPSFKNPILLFTSFTPPGISGINGTTVTVFYLLSELESDWTVDEISELRCPVEDDLLLKRENGRQIMGSENHTVFIKVRQMNIFESDLNTFQNSIRFSYFGDHFHRNNLPKRLCLFNFLDTATHLCNIFRLGILKL